MLIKGLQFKTNQCLWNEVLRNPGLRILDAVEWYGYTDQSHLMREFL